MEITWLLTRGAEIPLTISGERGFSWVWMESVLGLGRMPQVYVGTNHDLESFNFFLENVSRIWAEGLAFCRLWMTAKLHRRPLFFDAAAASLSSELCVLNPLVSLHTREVLCILLSAFPIVFGSATAECLRPPHSLLKTSHRYLRLFNQTNSSPKKCGHRISASWTKNSSFDSSINIVEGPSSNTRALDGTGVSRRPRWLHVHVLSCLSIIAKKTVTHSIIIAMLVYGVLFMDWGTEKTPFQGVSRSLKPIDSKGYSSIRFELGFADRRTRYGRQVQ